MIDLWDLAQTANFTEKELESFRVRNQGGVTFSCSLQWDQVLCSFFSDHNAFVFFSRAFSFPSLASAALGNQVVGSQVDTCANSLSASCVSIWQSGGLPSTVL